MFTAIFSVNMIRCVKPTNSCPPFVCRIFSLNLRPPTEKSTAGIISIIIIVESTFWMDGDRWVLKTHDSWARSYFLIFPFSLLWVCHGSLSTGIRPISSNNVYNSNNIIKSTDLRSTVQCYSRTETEKGSHTYCIAHNNIAPGYFNVSVKILAVSNQRPYASGSPPGRLHTPFMLTLPSFIVCFLYFLVLYTIM